MDYGTYYTFKIPWSEKLLRGGKTVTKNVCADSFNQKWKIHLKIIFMLPFIVITSDDTFPH